MPSIGFISIGVLGLLALVSYYRTKSIMLKKALSGQALTALPHHYGLYSTLSLLLPTLILLLAFMLFADEVILLMLKNDLAAIKQAYGFADISLAKQKLFFYLNKSSQNELKILQIAANNYRLWHMIANSVYIALLASLVIFIVLNVRKKLRADFAARGRVEFYLTLIIATASLVAILATLGIVLSLLFEAVRFFKQVPLSDFLFGLHWSPQISIRENQVGATGAFGAVPLFAGTFLITGIAMMIAAPFGLLSAVYLSEYAGDRFRTYIKPLLEILAGIPTVVYGFFASLTIAPLLKNWGEFLGLSVSAESALAAGLVMGIMILPFISSLSDDVLTAVPQNMRDGSYALGATKSETIVKVLIPAALPGIAGAFLLAISRAIGETMIVVMASGLVANLTANPLQAVTTVTTQIATLLVGDQEFDNPKTLAAFALGLVLFFMTMVLNMLAMAIVRRYREQYE